jgi:D-lactate dehydrogenase (cytochrome)
VTDICVPISKLGGAMAHARGLIDAAGLVAPMLGHVGDGNFHVFFILDPSSPDEWTRASAVNKAMIEYAIAAGGTSTGEHGIGLGKRQALLDEHGSEAVALMRAIKQAIDPMNIMNPGKIFMDGDN